MTISLQRLEGQPLAQRLRIRGHTLQADTSEANGGGDAGPSPHDLYDAALGACKAITVLSYARRKGIPVDEIETEIVRDDSQERAGTYRLTAKLHIRGALTDEQIEELARVADRCPLHKLMTTVTTEIVSEVGRL
jgi:putative redox protein